jgi:ABC-type transporter Mla subunit MlaD
VVANQLALVMAGAELRQQNMIEKMEVFVEQLTLSASSSQNVAQARLQSALDEIASRMGAVIQSMSTQIQEASESGRRVQTELMQENRQAIGGFGGQINLLVDGVIKATEEMKSTVSAMRFSTGTTVAQMSASADRLYAASSSFAQTGQEMSTVLGKATNLISEFDKASGSIFGVSGELSKLLSDYQATGDAMTTFLDSLRTSVEQTRRESSATQEVLLLIETATSKLVDAQNQADSFLLRIADVIQESHHAFTAGMVRSVDVANSDFHKALSASISLLQVGIQELAATLEELGALRISWSDRGSFVSDR